MSHSSLFPELNERAGFNMTIQNGNVLSKYDLTELVADPSKLWYHNFTVTNPPTSTPYQHMMASKWSGSPVTQTDITNWTTLAANNTGRKWLFMNEPDVAGQAQQTPQAYAVGYKWFYDEMKSADSTCKIYAGGITQPSVQRIRWIDEMIDHYETTYSEPFPCDGWHIHMYNLPEGSGAGVGYAYGVSNQTSDPNVANSTENSDWWWEQRDRSIDDFRANLLAFRVWMYNNDYEDCPLMISEYGLLRHFGWTTNAEYMTTTLSHALDAYDNTVGCPSDRQRLVQEFCWFPINYNNGSDIFSQSWLFNFHSPYELTIMGEAYRDWWINNFDVELWLDENGLDFILDEDGSKIILG